MIISLEHEAEWLVRTHDQYGRTKYMQNYEDTHEPEQVDAFKALVLEKFEAVKRERLAP